MDYAPAQLIHAIRLGMDDVVLNSKTMWLCAACETCTTRCPQDVDISKVMDAVKVLAVKKGVRPRVQDVRSFHKAVLANLRKFGRMYEIGLIMSLKLRTRQFFKDMGLGMQMFRKGKLKVVPSFRGVWRLRRIMSRLKKLEGEGRS
jgi:heterodisulfide reductase subunit C